MYTHVSPMTTKNAGDTASLKMAAKLTDSDIKKVTCCKCSRRRDLYFVGSAIFCVDDALREMVSFINT